MVNQSCQDSNSIVDSSNLGSAQMDTAVINNKLVIVSETLPIPILLTYDVSTKLVSQTTIPINVRDIWGVDDGLAVNTRPTTLSTTHRYNLKNQGWSRSVQSANSSYNSTVVSQPDCIDYTFASKGVYPSNADAWTQGKDTNPSSGNYELYYPPILFNNSVRTFLVYSSCSDSNIFSPQRGQIIMIVLPCFSFSFLH